MRIEKGNKGRTMNFTITEAGTVKQKIRVPKRRSFTGLPSYRTWFFPIIDRNHAFIRLGKVYIPLSMAGKKVQVTIKEINDD